MKPKTAASRPTESFACARARRSVFSGASLAAMAVGGLLAFSSTESRADQFILMDGTINYTWDDAMNAKPDKSHFYVNEGNFLNKNRPVNWVSPVDYRNGFLHVRAEVFQKPAGTQTTGWTLCYISEKGGGYGCADTDYYKSTGVFEREVKMTDFWQNDQVQWATGVHQVDLIYAINDSGMGHVTNYPALKDLTTPTRVRITMVQVSAGAKYDPSIITGIGDGGVAGGSSDAGGRDGAGGFGGLGGAFGMGGGMPVNTGGGGMGGLLGMSGIAGMGTMGGAMGGAPITTAPPPSSGSTGTTTGAGGSSGASTPAAQAPQDAATSCALTARSPEPGPAAFAGWFAVCLAGLAWRSRARRS